ncbi:F0F1 ATP synthase subunit B [Pacificibacter marinus]|uniref:ATP synthase subunit b n=1 Tax=Pacificibacter marinus TaxID=658057 RepID=A0A1Y5S970_9RHOB|nr:F0F1 ATP synthase subunit B [Pacificibacter marinus]SEK76054.1 F-type H+-transporting ATPase subunit b [Pacificibacter marinus]SLN34648.1 ATP synthase subunit b precursor [Pacificibacter marinus]
MKKALLSLTLAVAATPAFAASGPFVSFNNTNFIVLLGFLVFVGILLYAKVPELISGMLDKRAEGISSELEEARALREEAQTILASYERKQREVQDLADAIVAQAKVDADTNAVKAKEDIKTSIARRLASAQDQIASAQAAAVRDVRNTAVTVAIAAAKDVIAKQMTVTDANKLIDEAIVDVSEKLH